MTILAAPEMTNVLDGDINWQIVEVHGGCPLVDWCDGEHPLPPYRNRVTKVRHERSIGSAMRLDWTAELLVEVWVTQWKAAPGVDWVEGMDGPGWPNRDKAPQVGIFTYPADGSSDGLWLDRPYGAPLVTILRGIGQNAFADLLDTAIQFAHKLDEETKR